MTHRRDDVRVVLDRVKAEDRTALTAPECKRVCDAYDIPLPEEGLANSPVEAVEIADRIGYPVVLKIVAADIQHKTEAGGVLVGMADAAAVAAGYDSIIASVQAYKPDSTIVGVQVQQMLDNHDQEVIVGINRPPIFESVLGVNSSRLRTIM